MEDYRLSEEIDGIIWACEGQMRFRTLPGATHDPPVIDPGEVCPSKAKERGIDVEGARGISGVGTIDAGPLPAGSLNDVLPRAGTMDNSRTSIRRSIRVPSFRFPTNNTLH